MESTNKTESLLKNNIQKIGRMNTLIFLRRNVLKTLVLRLLGKDVHFCKSHLASLCTWITDSTESSHAMIQQLLGGSAHSWGIVLSDCCRVGNIPHPHWLKGYTIPLIPIHKAIKLPYYQCRKT